MYSSIGDVRAVHLRHGTVLVVALLCLGLSSCAQESSQDSGPGQEEPSSGVTEEDGVLSNSDGTSNGSQAPDVEWVADGVISPGEYGAAIDQGTYRLYWRQSDGLIYVGMEARTEGWVAVGIQPGRAMDEADLVIGRIVGGEVVVTDEYSSGMFGPHGPDTDFGGSDDIIDVGGSEADSVTVIEFSRALDTADSYDNPLVPGSVNKVIWAYGSSDDSSIQHSTRGYGEIVL